MEKCQGGNFRQSNWLIELSLRRYFKRANSRKTLYFLQLNIFPPSGDPALGIFKLKTVMEALIPLIEDCPYNYKKSLNPGSFVVLPKDLFLA